MKSTELDGDGLLVTCPKCGQRNRLKYGRLGQIGRCGKCGAELRPSGEPVEVVNDFLFDALVSRSALPLLVDFWAPWCGPCRMVAPEIDKVAREGAGKWIVAKVNTEAVPGLAGRYRISAIPTMVIFRDGLELGRQAGAMPAPAIRKFLAPYLAGGSLPR